MHLLLLQIHVITALGEYQVLKNFGIVAIRKLFLLIWLRDHVTILSKLEVLFGGVPRLGLPFILIHDFIGDLFATSFLTQKELGVQIAVGLVEILWIVFDEFLSFLLEALSLQRLLLLEFGIDFLSFNKLRASGFL